MEALFTIFSPGWKFGLLLGSIVLALGIVRNFLEGLSIVKSCATFALKVESRLLGLLLITMIVTAILQIILRNFFNSGIPWVDPLQRSLVLWIAFLGATMATRQGRHVSIDALSRFFTGNSKLTVLVITDLAGSIVSIILANAAWTFLYDEWQYGDVRFLGVPSWVIAVIIPVGFGVISYRFFYRVIAHLRVFGEEEEPADVDEVKGAVS